jgi:hypothetical protein
MLYALCTFAEELSHQLPSLLVSFERALGTDKIPSTDYVRSSVGVLVSRTHAFCAAGGPTGSLGRACPRGPSLFFVNAL